MSERASDGERKFKRYTSNCIFILSKKGSHYNICVLLCSPSLHLSPPLHLPRHPISQPFGDDHDKQYVYKEPALTTLAEIVLRLQKLYSKKFGMATAVNIIHESGKVGKNYCLFYLFCLAQVLLQKKVCSHLAGLEPATFRLTAERANRLRHKCLPASLYRLFSSVVV